MSYLILKSDGTVLTTILDGTINTTSTSVGLPGRLYPGYGQVVDTNFVHVIENFADSTPPNAALKGQLWYNTANSTLCVAPSDSPSASSWVVISTVGGNASFSNLTTTGNVNANNLAISNTATANAITVNYATVNVSANITNANITGNLVASNVLTNLVSTGSQTLVGNLVGTWTVSGGLDGNSLCVNDGNLYIENGGFGIKTDSYMYANGVAVSFDGTYTNTNVASYLAVYTGNVGLVGGGANLNGDTLNTGSASNPGTIIGNWTIQAGSQITGFSNISGSSISGTVDSANLAVYAVNVIGNNQPNIISVGTLTSLTSSGNISGANLISTAYAISSVGTGITATGTSQGDAYALVRQINGITSTTLGTGVRLPAIISGMIIIVMNLDSSNVLNVYPDSGSTINDLATNNPYSLVAGGRLQFVALTSSQWYTLNATYG